VIYRQHDLTTKFPFADNEFDVVHTAEVVEHLMDTVAYLKECFRVLKPGGRFVLSTPNLHYWRNLVLWLKGQQFFFVDYRGDQEGHVRYFCNGSLREIALKAGFKDINFKTVGNWPTQSLILKVVAPFFKLFAPMKHLILIMSATKP
jgi:2-polyprenyl-3-methyl-5-hydroxy-6-metoxy-1,4-benzoquinol methylase